MEFCVQWKLLCYQKAGLKLLFNITDFDKLLDLTKATGIAGNDLLEKFVRKVVDFGLAVSESVRRKLKHDDYCFLRASV